MRKEIKILLYVSGIWYLTEGMLGPLIAVFAERVGGNILDISWAWAIYLMVSGFLTILIGKFSDTTSKENILMVGYFLNAIFTFAYIFVSSPIELFIIQLMLGISTACVLPTWYALYDEYTYKKNDGALWGIADGLRTSITGVSIILLFTVMGAAQLVATVFLWMFLTKKKRLH